MGTAVSSAVQVMAVLLFAIGVAAFRNLLNGCFMLRRIARAGRQDHSPAVLKSPLVPAVSTIAVPPDASPESVGFARRLLEQHFGRNEVVIVLDGPTEAELAVWSTEFRLCPSPRVVKPTLSTAPVRGVYESRDPIRVVVIDKEKGGPVDAWNAAANACSSPVIGLLDPASDFLPDVMLRMIQPMMEAYDETIAICGGISVPAGAGLASEFGALQSLRTWMTRGAAMAGGNRTLPFPGAAILVKRAAVVQAGGFTGGPLELFVRLHGLALATSTPYRILFFPEPVSKGRTPETFGDLRRQVGREQRELARTFSHRIALAGPFGWQLLRGLALSQLARPWLETMAFALTAIGLIAGWVDGWTALVVLLATVGMGIVLSMAAVVLREVAEPTSPDERRMASLFFAAVPENLGYGQLRNLWQIAAPWGRDGSAEQADGQSAAARPPAVSAAQG